MGLMRWCYIFLVHTIIGFNAGNLANIQMKAKNNPAHFPLWLRSAYVTIGANICIFVAFAAPLTTLVQWGVGWTFATIVEIILGAFLAGLFPMGLRIILALIAPVISLIIIAGLWGF